MCSANHSLTVVMNTMLYSASQHSTCHVVLALIEASSTLAVPEKGTGVDGLHALSTLGSASTMCVLLHVRVAVFP